MRTLCALSKLQLAEELEEDILHIICDFIAEVYGFRGPLAEADGLHSEKILLHLLPHPRKPPQHNIYQTGSASSYDLGESADSLPTNIQAD